MSKYTQEEETEIVRNAMNLTAAIQLERDELAKLKSEHFKKQPDPPVRKVLSQPDIKPKYPDKPKYPYAVFLKEFPQKNKKHLIAAGIVVALIFIIITFTEGLFYSIYLVLSFASLSAFLFVILSYRTYYKKRSVKEHELANAPEYLNAVAEAEKNAQEQQK